MYTRHMILSLLVVALIAVAKVDASEAVTPVQLEKRQNVPTPTEGAGFLPSPIDQPSIGGGAGTFNVVSLARSSSYDFSQNNGVQQTTTFQAPPPAFSTPEAVAASYPAGESSSARRAAASATTPLPSLKGTSTASVISNGNGNAAVSDLTNHGVVLPLVAIVFAAGAGAWIV
ncbi:unnamed protein product [Sympodiomycopsis kandeliae]